MSLQSLIGNTAAELHEQLLQYGGFKQLAVGLSIARLCCSAGLKQTGYDTNAAASKPQGA
jgi:hypothetical protein